jgi:hypothetical protein
MLKISPSGTPVVWLHENPGITEREFPIKDNPLSELIFVKKIKNTFKLILHFPKNYSIENKRELISYLHIEKIKICNIINKFP